MILAWVFDRLNETYEVCGFYESKEESTSDKTAKAMDASS